MNVEKASFWSTGIGGGGSDRLLEIRSKPNPQLTMLNFFIQRGRGLAHKGAELLSTNSVCCVKATADKGQTFSNLLSVTVAFCTIQDLQKAWHATPVKSLQEREQGSDHCFAAASSLTSYSTNPSAIEIEVKIPNPTVRHHAGRQESGQGIQTIYQKFGPNPTLILQHSISLFRGGMVLLTMEQSF